MQSRKSRKLSNLSNSPENIYSLGLGKSVPGPEYRVGVKIGLFCCEEISFSAVEEKDSCPTKRGLSALAKREVRQNSKVRQCNKVRKCNKVRQCNIVRQCNKVGQSFCAETKEKETN